MDKVGKEKDKEMEGVREGRKGIYRINEEQYSKIYS